MLKSLLLATALFIPNIASAQEAQRDYESKIAEMQHAMSTVTQVALSNPFQGANLRAAILQMHQSTNPPERMTGWVCNIESIQGNAERYGDRYNGQEHIGWDWSANDLGAIECRNPPRRKGAYADTDRVNATVYLLIFERADPNWAFLSSVSRGDNIIFSGIYRARRISDRITIVTRATAKKINAP
jgi:hypothetical protein